MLEKIVETYLRESVINLGGLCYKFVSPGNNGVPDRICIFPNGKIAFVECKQPNGKLSSLQERQIYKLKSLNCKVYVVWCKDDVKRFVNEFRST